MRNPLLAFVLGSKSDLPLLDEAEKFLREMNLPYEVRIISAHRTPERAREFALAARDRGLRAIVGVAGLAAHLSGVLAASSRGVPVLGVPAGGGSLGGIDSLLSTVQMPGGVPVATFAIGKPGATNAAIFAAQMIALHDPSLQSRLDQWRTTLIQRVEKDDEETRGARGDGA
jgi:5-(carboxyamino)imidazole ribonucleotide mutase